ncbi:TPA: hypothetical protein ACSUN1_003108 [Salmonella enterica subsp. diarizonae]
MNGNYDPIITTQTYNFGLMEEISNVKTIADELTKIGLCDPVLIAAIYTGIINKERNHIMTNPDEY